MMNFSKICIATTNKHKLKEIYAIFEKSNLGNIKFYTLNDFENIPEPDEPFENFLDNAIYKAKFYSKYTNMPTLSDDTGLEVVNLNNFPGVHTKRFLDECGGFVSANKKLEEMLNGKDPLSRFVCVSVIFDPSTNETLHARGEMNGKIVFENIAKNGFAYDTMFIPEGYNDTLAALGDAIKMEVSHRAHAIRKLIEMMSAQND